MWLRITLFRENLLCIISHIQIKSIHTWNALNIYSILSFGIYDFNCQMSIIERDEPSRFMAMA